VFPVRRGFPVRPMALPIRLSQHADQHRPERPVLLTVDQQLGERPRLRVSPELADPVGSLEVRKHEDVEQLGASRRRESLEASLEPCLYLLEGHEGTQYLWATPVAAAKVYVGTSARIRTVARRSPAARCDRIAELAQDLAGLLGQVRCASADD